ncbi:MAG: hypothetical protein IJP03_03870 [Christensenellaceae bacterium]|nr:hypothetical protein [Christensenellaceae bacterium]
MNSNKTKKCSLCLLLVICLLGAMLAGCGPAEDTPAVAEEFVRLMWDVDYRTFGAEENTAFAKKHYAKDYLEGYLADEAAGAGTASAAEDQLISRVVDIAHTGSKTAVIGGREYLIENIRVDVFIDHYRPEFPEMSFFEEGKQFCLLYEVYFVEEEGQWKLTQYLYEPEGEEFLPAGEKEELPEEGRRAISRIVQGYLDVRYNCSYLAYDEDHIWQFYEDNLTPSLLARDGIDRQYLARFADALEADRVEIVLQESSAEIGTQKKYVADDAESGFYYWAKVEYTFTVDAPVEFLQANGLGAENKVTEMLYFRQEDGVYRLALAEYL